MGRELQKKKRRAARQPVRPKKPAKVLNPRGNNIIAQNWDKKQTLAQNYRRLGLVARLKGPTGGIEKKLGDASDAAAATLPPNPFGIVAVDKAVVSEARVERDAAGNITRVLGSDLDNPLNDPLCALEDEDGAGGGEHGWGGVAEADGAGVVVQSLVAQAQNPGPKRPRYVSEAEAAWLRRLMARYGDDTAAMARDLKLNPMQQTAADIARRIRRLPPAA